MNEPVASRPSTTRRDFLSTSAAVVGGALIANATRAADPEPAAERASAKPKRNWKKAFYGNVNGNSLMEKFKLLKDAGFDGVEINSPGQKREDVLAALKDTGLLCEGVVDSVHWNTTLSDAD